MMVNGEQRFEQLSKLAELAASRHDARRDYEWKITLGFWAVMLTSMHKDWSFPSGIEWGWFVFAGVWFTLFWVYGVWVANCSDKDRYDFYFKKAAETALGAPESDFISEKKGDMPKRVRYSFLDGGWAQVFQLGATIAILSLLYMTTRQSS